MRGASILVVACLTLLVNADVEWTPSGYLLCHARIALEFMCRKGHICFRECIIRTQTDPSPHTLDIATEIHRSRCLKSIGITSDGFVKW